MYVILIIAVTLVVVAINVGGMIALKKAIKTVEIERLEIEASYANYVELKNDIPEDVFISAYEIARDNDNIILIDEKEEKTNATSILGVA